MIIGSDTLLTCLSGSRRGPGKDEFEEEEDPQEEEDDMEVDIEEDENEPELTYPYEKVDPLNPPPPTFEFEPDDEIEVENPIEHEDETFPVSIYEVGESSTAAIPREDGDRLLPGFMRRDIDSLFGRMVNFSRRVSLGSRGRAGLGLEQGRNCCNGTMGGFVFEERPNEAIICSDEADECPSLSRQGFLIMPPKSAPMTQAAMRRLIKESVDAAIAAKRDRQAKVRNDVSGSGPVRGQDTAPAVRECTFDGFIKCNPTVFRGIERAVELRRWFEKTESVFGINECVEGKKVRFAAATLEGTALTWWNSKIATMGLETMNRMPWTEMKQLMTSEFCPIKEIQRMEHELWNLKVKEYDIVAYTQRFNELALMYPRMVEPERVKVDAYIRGLTNNIKGGVTSSKPANLNEAVRMAHKLMEQKSDNSLQTLQNNQKQGNARAMVSAPIHGKLPLCERCFTRHIGQCTIIVHTSCGNVGHKSCGTIREGVARIVKQEEVGEVRGRAYAIKDVEPKGPNVVTGTFLLNNRYASVLFDSGSDRSFVNTRFSSFLDIKRVIKIERFVMTA
ncbi:putative reverse transcriptase domain-containing protein [Tanacetum coccineum]